jgi:hypothetical protein
MSLQTVKPPIALALSSFLAYGAFSRLTHGEYTPQMHAYQTDRSPDDGSTLATIIPCMDLLFATLVLIPKTRVAGAALCTCVMALGMIARRFEGKDPTMDALLTLGVFACWMVLGRVEW